MEYGIEVLSKYYDTHIQSFNKVVVIEHSIKGVTVGNVPIKGKLDKIEFDGKNVNVVDYKSGNPENGLKKLDPPNEKEPNGGDYWRQAVFYKILVDNKSSKDWNAVSTEFDFIEPDKKKSYKKKKLVITPEDITTVTQQITTTWEKIQNKEFYKYNDRKYKLGFHAAASACPTRMAACLRPTTRCSCACIAAICLATSSASSLRQALRARATTCARRCARSSAKAAARSSTCGPRARARTSSRGFSRSAGLATM
jgi:hypothetical protein